MLQANGGVVISGSAMTVGGISMCDYSHYGKLAASAGPP